MTAMTDRQLYALMISVVTEQLEIADDLYNRHPTSYNYMPYLYNLYELINNVRNITEKPDFKNLETKKLKIAVAAVFFWLGMRQYADDLYFIPIGIKTLKISIKSKLLDSLIENKPYILNEENFKMGVRFSIEPTFTNEKNIHFAPRSFNIIKLFQELVNNHPDFYKAIKKVINKTFNMYSKNCKIHFYNSNQNFNWVSLTCEINKYPILNQISVDIPIIPQNNEELINDKILKKENLLKLIFEKKELIKLMKEKSEKKKIINIENNILFELIKNINNL